MAPKPHRRLSEAARPAPPSSSSTRSSAPRGATASESQGSQLWLFPARENLRASLSERCLETRQLSCAHGRLAVLERGGTGVRMHDLPAGNDGAGLPNYIKLGNKIKIYSMDQGANHMIILSSEGEAYEYSINDARLRCVVKEKIIIQIACGDDYSLALSKGGELFAWGNNCHGQLGLGEKIESAYLPQTVTHLLGIPLAQISAGEAHSMALSMSGNIYSWGKNNLGQLGLGHTKDEVFPSFIEELEDQKVEFLSCGGSHTALLTKDGLVFTFGAGEYGQLGHHSTQNELRPRLVTELIGKRVTQIACGRSHTLAYVPDLEKVFAFGFGQEGQLGNSGTKNQLIPLPMKLSANEELRLEHCTSEKELIMIAGGNQSILLWIKKENSYVNLRRKIPTLNENTAKRWNEDVGTKQWQSTKREIRDIFSSAACVTGSFLKERIGTGKKSFNSDVNKARDIFKTLTQKDSINSTIATHVKENLFTNLPLSTPHGEALEIFLLLPEYLVTQDSHTWDSLGILYAKAVNTISKKSSEILESFWASLEKSTFEKLIKIFQKGIITICSETGEDHKSIKTLLKMLKKLYMKHSQPSEDCTCSGALGGADLLPPEHHRPPGAQDGTGPAESDREQGTSKKHSPYAIFSHFPFVLCSLSKAKLLHAQSKLEMKNSVFIILKGPRNLASVSSASQLMIRRRNLVEDTFAQADWFEKQLLWRALQVSFSGEPQDNCNFQRAQKEFFQSMFQQLSKPEYGMFFYPEDASYMWFPVKPKFKKRRYYIFGLLCGLCVYNLNVANLPFPLALFKKLQNLPPSLEDLKELCPFLGRYLQALLKDESKSSEEVFSIYFNIHWNNTDVEVIQNGNHIMVNQTNKKMYVSKCIDYIFNTSVKDVYEEFQKGFFKVCDKDVIGIFKPEELMYAVTRNTDYNWITFEKNAIYEQEYSRLHPTIVMFWDALHTLTVEEKKKFFVFFTGTDRLPTNSLRNMIITFRCPETTNENMPITVHTNFSVLILPKYSTMTRMKEALEVAISNKRI
ncbi:PREDICTED: E3 ISG15--protein ligase HERC5 [Elephantulus edwardii]|uniref:E3 ISG15--protein ligase HERC5 n=1 Tax=Elephantulus edwardii TaxID=28737 RepID=UPI0003F062E6|nr:PREDICTED: E3 ISG15--protein ligase HERC5 [Elephantulus edwardii]